MFYRTPSRPVVAPDPVEVRWKRRARRRVKVGWFVAISATVAVAAHLAIGWMCMPPSPSDECIATRAQADTAWSQLSSVAIDPPGYGWFTPRQSADALVIDVRDRAIALEQAARASCGGSAIVPGHASRNPDPLHAVALGHGMRR